MILFGQNTALDTLLSLRTIYVVRAENSSSVSFGLSVHSPPTPLEDVSRRIMS